MSRTPPADLFFQRVLYAIRPEHPLCRSGNRSVTASLAAQTAGLPYNAHLAGGIKAWKEAGLPTET